MTLAKDATALQAEKALDVFLQWWQKQYYALVHETDGLPECARLLSLAAYEYGHLLHHGRAHESDMGSGRCSGVTKKHAADITEG